jgi:hemerythrin
VNLSLTELRWSDAYLLGYPPIDDTHREFVEVVDSMLRARDAELADAIAAFERHAEAHFGQEAVWMEETGFPAIQCHVDEHDAVMKSVRRVRERVAAGDIDIGRRLAMELVRWFPAHADYMDSALAQWMVKKRFGGVPVVLKRNLDGAP